MNTQYINRVELQGRVGTVRISPVHDTIVANFSVMTEHMYEASDGNKVVEATWMCVAAFEGVMYRRDPHCAYPSLKLDTIDLLCIHIGIVVSDIHS